MEFLEMIKDKKILLYGLGTETERVISQWNDKYKIIGLLDSFRNEGEMFGYPIVDINEVINEDNIIIVVVARPGSCKAIEKRIGDLCRRYSVKLFDIRGKNLLQKNKIVFDFKNIEHEYKYEMLLSLIRDAEVISFDLIDTLVARSVLSQMDLLEIVNERLKEQGIFINDFVNRRLAAEKQLSQRKSPCLTEIYEFAFCKEKDICLQELADLEYMVDKGLIVPRKAMISLFKKISSRKRIFITTDMYYRKEQIMELLQNCGIKGFSDVLVSCECGSGKEKELFEILKNVAGTDNILHIGDDIVSDIQSAALHGIRSFQIYSVEELFSLVGELGLSSYTNILSNRIKIGMFIANVFNNPFQFEDEQRKIIVEDAFDIGFLFCAPMIVDYVQWFGKIIHARDLKNVFFCARDGYLIQKIYEKYYPENESFYYLTSRIASIRAGMLTKEDIAYVDSMKYSGEVEDNLFTRFGLRADEINPSQIDFGEEGLQKYAKAILQSAEGKRKNNIKYIQTIQMHEGGIAFFDFVAKGTSQMYAERLIQNKITGVYFLQLEPEFMEDKGLDIIAFYNKEDESSRGIFENYYLLETLLTSPDPLVEEFDIEGKAIYAKETRKKRDIHCVLKAQEGVLEYVDRYLRICPKNERKINKKLDEAFLTLIHNVKIEDDDFLGLTIEDPFFNRMTDITDVL